MEKENSTISLKDKLRLGGIVILCAICSNLEYDLAKTLQMDKNPTTQNQVPFQSEIEKYGFDVDQDSKTLTMALQFNHNE
jgi:hypothetical protein